MTYLIVTFDGGGVRGALSASMLKVLLSQHPGLLDSAKLYSGTSTGAIIAALLATKTPVETVLEMYTKHAGAVFVKDRLSALGALKSKYKQQGIRDLLVSVFGEKKLGEVVARLCIPVSNITRGEAVVFDSHQQSHKELLLVDVILASCAAPTFFDPIKIHGELYADGGLWAMDPSVAVLILLRRNGNNFKNLKLLSFGTGKNYRIYSDEQAKQLGWGMLGGWQGTKVLSLFDKLQTSSSALITGALISPNRYLKLDAKLTKQVDLDDSKAVEWLIDLGQTTAHQLAPQVTKFLKPNPKKWYYWFNRRS